MLVGSSAAVDFAWCFFLSSTLAETSTGRTRGFNSARAGPLQCQRACSIIIDGEARRMHSCLSARAVLTFLCLLPVSVAETSGGTAVTLSRTKLSTRADGCRYSCGRSSFCWSSLATLPLYLADCFCSFALQGAYSAELYREFGGDRNVAEAPRTHTYLQEALL